MLDNVKLLKGLLKSCLSMMYVDKINNMAIITEDIGAHTVGDGGINIENDQYVNPYPKIP